MTYHILFNPCAGSGKGEQNAKQLDTALSGNELKYYDMTKITDYESLLLGIPSDEPLVLAGGDGTISRFLNDTRGIGIPNDILYYATGSGNDFLHDLGIEKGAVPFPIKQYLQNLPTVTVKGRDYLFLNGIGYGIDGYCCEVGDKLREKSDKPVNYAGIAIKGLLFHFKRSNAKVTVDGKTKTYRRVWLAPTMNGRYYGGGMNITPAQNRLNPERKVSVCVMHGGGKLKTLLVFPGIFKGEHIKYTKMVEILTGHEVKVEFDRPCALQIDGETILGVTEYTVRAKVPATV